MLFVFKPFALSFSKVASTEQGFDKPPFVKQAIRQDFGSCSIDHERAVHNFKQHHNPRATEWDDPLP